MKVSLKDFASFVLTSTATSMLLNSLRHPMFGAFNFNCTVLTLETVFYVLLARTMPLRVHISSVSMFTILGYLISAVAYAFTSIVLDKFGIGGLHTSIARLGSPSYLVNCASYGRSPNYGRRRCSDFATWLGTNSSHETELVQCQIECQMWVFKGKSGVRIFNDIRNLLI
jgi:hypothetical protein